MSFSAACRSRRSASMIDGCARRRRPAARGCGAVCAALMSEADLTGADAHGVFRLPQYVRRLKAGGFNKHPNITVTRNAPATALVDGDNGMGHLVMTRAAETAIALARTPACRGSACAARTMRGRRGFTPRCRRRPGMIGIYSAVANANHMAVWGGADPLLGTNPLAIGVPSRRRARGARHGDDGRLLRHGEELRAAGKAHGEGLDGQHRNRRGHHRREEERRRPAAADRRLQGLAGLP